MRHFTIFWRTGEAQVVTGHSIEDAFRCAGFGAGALAAVDFYDNGDVRKKWTYSVIAGEWVRNPEFIEPEPVPTPIIQVPINATSRIEAKLMQTKEGMQLDIRKFVAPDDSDTWIPTTKGIRLPQSFLHDLVEGLRQIEEAM